MYGLYLCFFLFLQQPPESSGTATRLSDAVLEQIGVGHSPLCIKVERRAVAGLDKVHNIICANSDFNCRRQQRLFKCTWICE